MQFTTSKDLKSLLKWSYQVPADVLAPDPADDPVEPSAMFHGFFVRPPNQISSQANAPAESLAIKTAPAAFNLIHLHRHKQNFRWEDVCKFLYIYIQTTHAKFSDQLYMYNEL